MEELPLTNRAARPLLLVSLFLILCVGVYGNSHGHNHSSAGRGAVSSEGDNSPSTLPLLSSEHFKEEPTQDVQEVAELPVKQAHRGHQKWRGAKHHHHDSGHKNSGNAEPMTASPFLMITRENHDRQDKSHSSYLKNHDDHEAHHEFFKIAGSHRLQTKSRRKASKAHRSFNIKENLVIPSGMDEKSLKLVEGLITHEKKKLQNSKHSTGTHHQHHRRQQHHKHAHHKHLEHLDQHSRSKFAPKSRVLRGKIIDPLDVPELEGFVLQEFHEEDFEGERLYFGDGKSEMADHKAVSAGLDSGDHSSIPHERASGKEKRKLPKKFKKKLVKEKVRKPKDIKVEVKQFKDFDLTVLDVPSLSGNVPKKPKHPRRDMMVNDEPVSNKSSPHNTLDHHGFRFSKKRPNEAKMTISKIDVPPKERHHIARRIGDGGDFKMMNPFGSVLESGLVKKLGDAETFTMTRDSEIIFENPQKGMAKSSRYLHGATPASRYRREEGAPGSPIGAAAAAAAIPRPKNAEPLDYEAAHANHNTELDAEVDIDMTDVDADVMVDADAGADQSSASGVDEAISTPFTALEHSSTTFTPDVMPSISCSGDQQCAEVQDAVCGQDGTCVCPDATPVYIADISGCLKGAALNTSCQYDEQCLYMEEHYGRCGPGNICNCVKGYEVKMHPNVGINCVEHSSSVNPVDPTMIGVLVGLALMFIIICVVLRLFSKARFRENRSIFNTPNPRLMNASMFKDRRRGSGVSVGSGPVGSPPATALSRSSPTPETPKSGTATSPDKNKKDQSAVNIEAVD